MKKAVFFDIDGTLLDFRNHIPPSTVEGIRRLREKGNLAFICTGRTRGFVRNEELLAIGFDGIISGCGTMVEYRDELLYYKTIENKEVKKTVAYLKAQNAAVIMEGRYYLYLDKEDFGDDPYVGRLGEEIGDYLLPIAESGQEWEVSKFSCATEKTDLERLKKDLSHQYELLIHGKSVVEIVPKGHSKGTGIRQICKSLQIPREDTFAFGDSANDFPMFETAGTSIAMGNGITQIKEMADYVTDDLNKDGIYHALEHYNLM